MTVSKLPNPFSSYGVLSGQLFLYAGGRAAFESPLPSPNESSETLSTKKCILIGGLSDGLLPVPYTQHLADVCAEVSWSLVQPIISSSYTGFGNGSLQRDCDELQELMNYLILHRNASEFCLVGHSTGCQDAVYFLEHASPELCERLKLVALQAPVSDREDASGRPEYEDNVAHARMLREQGKQDEMMPRHAFWAPITAQRFLDLQEKGGTDDYFSSDFTDEEMKARLQHVGSHSHMKVLVAFSGADEYVPSHIDTSKLTDRLVEAMNTHCDDTNQVAQRLYLENGNHNLSQDSEASSTFVAHLAKLLKADS